MSEVINFFDMLVNSLFIIWRSIKKINIYVETISETSSVHTITMIVVHSSNRN